MEHEQLDITIAADHIKKAGTKEDGTTSNNDSNHKADTKENTKIIKQKQEGLYTVSYHPVGGIPKSDFFRKLYETIADMQEVKIRLSPDQGMYVINLTKEELEKVIEITKDDSGTAFEKSTACIGADICQVGIGKSQTLLAACVKRVREEKFADGVLPSIHISGCPSSCSAHQTAIIGLRGGKKPTEDGPKYAFAVYENGCELEGAEQFGKEIGVMLEEDIPEFFAELGHAVADTGLNFMEFREKYPERILQIAQSYI